MSGPSKTGQYLTAEQWRALRDHMEAMAHYIDCEAAEYGFTNGASFNFEAPDGDWLIGVLPSCRT